MTSNLHTTQRSRFCLDDLALWAGLLLYHLMVLLESLLYYSEGSDLFLTDSQFIPYSIGIAGSRHHGSR